MAADDTFNGGGPGPFNFTFPSIKIEDIKVSVDGNVLGTSAYSVTNYVPDSGGRVNVPGGTASGTNNVRVFRQTDGNNLSHIFQAGSSLRSSDLNTNIKQVLYLSEENRESIAGLAVGSTGSVQISGSNILPDSITSDKIVNLEVKSADISSHATNDSLRAITTDHIRNDAITTDKLADSINTTIANKIEAGANNSIFTNDSNYITLAQVPTAFVTGMIIMWSGTIATIPSGWVLCDGNNSTPDLRDKFVVGARQDHSNQAKTNIEGSLKDHGGSTTATDTVTISDSDTVSITISGTTSNVNLNYSSPNPLTSMYSQSNHSHTFSGTGTDTVNISGSDTVNVDIVPPYYALAFIMKT